MKPNCDVTSRSGCCGACSAKKEDVQTSEIPGSLPRVGIIDEVSGERRALERFIQERFHREFAAELRSFLPYFLVLSDDGKTPKAVAGIRLGLGRFFLESYLGQPVERLLSAYTAGPVDRRVVVEIGNLASASPGSANGMLAALTVFLEAAGYQWAIFTATRTVRALFRRLGLHTIDLGPADADRVCRDGADWGSYYDHEPRVTASSVQLSYAALLENPRSASTLEQYWPEAKAAGRRFAESRQGEQHAAP